MVWARRKVRVGARSFGAQTMMVACPVNHASSTRKPRPATHANQWMRHLMCGNWQQSPASQYWLWCWSALHWSSGSWCIDASRTNGLYVNLSKKLRGHFIKLKPLTSSSSENWCNRTKEPLVTSREEETSERRTVYSDCRVYLDQKWTLFFIFFYLLDWLVKR